MQCISKIAEPSRAVDNVRATYREVVSLWRARGRVNEKGRKPKVFSAGDKEEGTMALISGRFAGRCAATWIESDVA